MEISAKIFQVAIFKCCSAPLNEIDLSFLNLKFLKIPDLEAHLKSVAGESALNEYRLSYEEWITKWNPDYLIALCSENIDTPLRKEVFDDMQRIMLILFPSEFRAYSMITFRVYDHSTIFGGEEQITVTPHRQREMKHPLTFDRNILPELEKFIKLYFTRQIPNYLRLCIDNYAAHYFQWKNSIAYLSLSICMESIAEGKDMLNYKIRRNLSIINGSTKEESQVIFANIKHLYELRSKIVHGEQYSESDLDAYLPYLRQLIACTIIELIVHGIDERKELDKKITMLGFGQKTQLSDFYEQHLPNCFCNLEVDLLRKPTKT